MPRRLFTLTVLHVALAATAGAQQRISTDATLPQTQTESAFQRVLLPLVTSLSEQGSQAPTVAI